MGTEEKYLSNYFVIIISWILNIGLLVLIIATVTNIIQRKFREAIKFFIGGLISTILFCSIISVLFFGGSPKKFSRIYVNYAKKTSTSIINWLPIGQTLRKPIYWILYNGIGVAEKIIGCGTSNGTDEDKDKDCVKELDNLRKGVINEINFLKTLLQKPDNNTYVIRGLGSYSIGHIYTPKLIAVNANIENIVNEIKIKLSRNQFNVDPNYRGYIKSLWSVAIFEITNNLIENNIIFDYDLEKRLAEKIATEGIKTLITEDGAKILRDILVALEIFKGKQANIKHAVKRFHAIITLILMVKDAFETINKINEFDTKKITAKAILTDIIIHDYLIMPLKNTSLYSNDDIYREVVDNYENLGNFVMDEAKRQEINRLISGTTGNIASLWLTLTIAGSIGGLPGILLGFVIGCTIATSVYIWDEGQVYLIKYNISCLQYTLAFDLYENNNILTSALFIDAANMNMENHVLNNISRDIYLNSSSNYIISMIKYIKIVFLEENQERKWKQYIDSYFIAKSIFGIKLSESKGKLNELIEDYFECVLDNR